MIFSSALVPERLTFSTALINEAVSKVDLSGSAGREVVVKSWSGVVEIFTSKKLVLAKVPA